MLSLTGMHNFFSSAIMMELVAEVVAWITSAVKVCAISRKGKFLTLYFLICVFFLEVKLLATFEAIPVPLIAVLRIRIVWFIIQMTVPVVRAIQFVNPCRGRVNIKWRYNPFNPTASTTVKNFILMFKLNLNLLRND